MQDHPAHDEGQLTQLVDTHCPDCAESLEGWARGGHHLCCRSCEVRAVANSAIDDRQRFYASLVRTAMRAGSSENSATQQASRLLTKANINTPTKSNLSKSAGSAH